MTGIGEAGEDMNGNKGNSDSKSYPLLLQWMIEPSSRISDPSQHRKAGLLSTFLLCLFLIFMSINVGYALLIPGYRFPMADLIGYVILIFTYILSRTRFTSLAAVIMLVMFPLNVFINIFHGTTMNPTATLTFLIPSYVLASIFFPLTGLAIYGFGCSLIMALLPLSAPNINSYSIIMGPLAVNVLSVVLLMIAVIHRSRIEQDRRSELLETYNNTLEGLSHTLEMRDKETEGHCHRVMEMTLQMALVCGIQGERLEHIYRGALLHDIGKLAIPDSILMKPAPLNDAEWAMMKSHPTIAFQMLSTIPFLKPALEIPAHHHEWWNGKGYPRGLKGEEIPLAARIFSLADVWDALLSNRPYRKAWTREQAVDYLLEQRGKQFDPNITERFLDLQNRKTNPSP